MAIQKKMNKKPMIDKDKFIPYRNNKLTLFSWQNFEASTNYIIRFSLRSDLLPHTTIEISYLPISRASLIHYNNDK